MGISCSILFSKNSYVSASSLLNTIQDICHDKNFILYEGLKETNESQKIKSVRTNISDMAFSQNVSRQLCVDIFDEPYQFKDTVFEWHNSDIEFFEAVVIDYFNKNEDLLLKILYEVLKRYPEAVVWIEEDWFYTLEDLEKIKNRPYDNEWCYKNPKYL